MGKRDFCKWLRDFNSVEHLLDFLYKEWEMEEAEFPELVIKAMSYFEVEYNNDTGYQFSFYDWLIQKYAELNLNFKKK